MHSWPANVPLKASQTSANTSYNEVNSELKSFKRSKLTTPNSPQSSTRTFEKVPKNQRKTNTRRKFLGRELSKYIDEKAKWFETISTRCNDLGNHITTQIERIVSLEALDVECCGIIADLSVDSLTRTKRTQIRTQFVNMEETRRKLVAELH